MYKVQNPQYHSRVLKYAKRNRFMNYIGFDLDVIEPGRAEGWLSVRDYHKQQKGLLHGGVISTLADIVVGFAAYTLVPEDCNIVTGEIKVSCLRAGTSDRVHAIGRVLKTGRKLNFCEAEVWDVNGENRKLIAKASATMITLFPGDFGSEPI